MFNFANRGDHMKKELEQMTAEAQCESGVVELSDLQLAIIGGGSTDVIFH